MYALMLPGSSSHQLGPNWTPTVRTRMAQTSKRDRPSFYVLFGSRQPGPTDSRAPKYTNNSSFGA